MKAAKAEQKPVVEETSPPAKPEPAGPKKKVRVATTWLDGCSGCHMSLLDIDQKLADVAGAIDLVYGPLVDFKEFPEGVDVTLVEGAVSNEEDAKKIRLIRNRSYLVVSFGDCAVTANVPGMRNQFKVDDVLKRGYVENADLNAAPPTLEVPPLLKRARPVHEIVNVDVFLPGCPPPSEAILFVLSELLEGRIPDLTGKTRFGA
ncbi:MAG TPA: NADP oxidoreductase [Desulfomonilaceae bacterium]|nr:NADP oxidoreductase [Desulfomonilaceae bacterium]